MRLRRVLATIPRDFKKLPRSIKWISVVFGVYSLAWGLVSPFLAIYFNQIVGTYTKTTFIIAVFFLFSAFLSVFMGRLADVLSKKKLIIIFLFLYLPLGPLLAIFKGVFQFTILRLYHSFTATGLWGTSEVYVRAHSPKHQRAESIGLFDGVHNLFLVVGALAGGVIVYFFNIPVLFYIMPFFIFSALIVTLLFLPDHHGSRNLRTGLTVLRLRLFIDSVRDFLENRPLCLVGFLSLLVALPLFAVQDVLLPLFSKALGANPIQIGIVFALAVLPFFFEAPLSVLSDHLSNRKILLASGLFSTVVLVLLFFTESILWVFALSFLVGLSFAFIIPTLDGVATGLMPKSNLGELNGVYRALVMLGSGLGILGMGPLADAFGIGVPFLFSAFIMAFFTLVSFLWWEKIEESEI